MATEKQVGMMLGRARAAGIEVVKSELVDLSNGQIDSFLEKCEKAREKVTEKHQEKEVNGIKFGMAAKIVLQDVGTYMVEKDPDFVAKRVYAVYDWLLKTEGLLSNGNVKEVI